MKNLEIKIEDFTKEPQVKILASQSNTKSGKDKFLIQEIKYFNSYLYNPSTIVKFIVRRDGNQVFRTKNLNLAIQSFNSIKI